MSPTTSCPFLAGPTRQCLPSGVPCGGEGTGAGTRTPGAGVSGALGAAAGGAAAGAVWAAAAVAAAGPLPIPLGGWPSLPPGGIPAAFQASTAAADLGTLSDKPQLGSAADKAGAVRMSVLCPPPVKAWRW